MLSTNSLKMKAILSIALVSLFLLVIGSSCGKHGQQTPSTVASISYTMESNGTQTTFKYQDTSAFPWAGYQPEIVFPDSNGRATLASPSYNQQEPQIDFNAISLSFNLPNQTLSPGTYTYELQGVNSPEGPDSATAYKGGRFDWSPMNTLIQIDLELVSDTVTITSVSGGLINGTFSATYYPVLGNTNVLRCHGEFSNFKHL